MFTHLHVHSEFSLLDGMCAFDKLVAKAKALGMDSWRLTDHGVMYGAIDFYVKAKGGRFTPHRWLRKYTFLRKADSANPGR